MVDCCRHYTPARGFDAIVFATEYRDCYSEAVLNEKAETIRELAKSGKDVYVYFNNTAGNAFENARYLQSKLIAQAVM